MYQQDNIEMVRDGSQTETFKEENTRVKYELVHIHEDLTKETTSLTVEEKLGQETQGLTGEDEPLVKINEPLLNQPDHNQKLPTKTEALAKNKLKKQFHLFQDTLKAKEIAFNELSQMMRLQAKDLQRLRRTCEEPGD